MAPHLVFGLPTHGFFVALGVAIAAVVFFLECRRRGAPGEQSMVAVTGALVGGAIGMRLSSLAETLDPLESWLFGARSVLGGLLGAYLGVLVAKRLIGYRERTGDLFAPAVALGMAVGRIGCHLTEAPGRPTGLPWGVHAPGTVPACPGCTSGAAMHPSFLYEIAFHLVAFLCLRWARDKITTPGELFTLYIGAYAIFRFLVEFTRANDTVWLDLTRPQWFLLPGLILVAVRWSIGYRRGTYDTLLGRKVAA